jgi:hypothetical protein
MAQCGQCRFTSCQLSDEAAMTADELDYFAGRMVEEQEAAGRATSAQARKIQNEIAAHYDDILRSYRHPSALAPEDGAN